MRNRTFYRYMLYAAGILFLYFFLSQLHDGYATSGWASWYGEKESGYKTANGEVYDEDKLTAAHRRLAFGTKLRVTNVNNQKSIIVRINDRGPYIPGRIIDLTKQAAKELGFLKQGLAKVRFEILKE